MITQLVWDLDINLYHELECPDRALNGEEPAQTIPRRIKLRRSKIVHWREKQYQLSSEEKRWQVHSVIKLMIRGATREKII